MSTTTTTTTGTATGPTRGATNHALRSAPPPIPFSRLVRVERRKMFDTRSGFWLMTAVLILSCLATVATLVFGDTSSLTFSDFASAVGVPMAIVLPMIGVLSVTSEWSQRTGLTTFTLVPGRGRVIAAKLLNVVAIGVMSMLIAAAVGALGNLLTSLLADTDAVWDVSVAEFAQIILANEIGMLMGFVIGLLVRTSAAAIVGYFVFAFVLPTISSALGAAQSWWADYAPWFELNTATFPLFDAAMTSEAWAQLGVSALLWLVLPGLLGLRLVLRTEVK